MRRVLFAMLLVAAPHGVSDVTWDFSEGWAAQEGSWLRKNWKGECSTGF